MGFLTVPRTFALTLLLLVFGGRVSMAADDPPAYLALGDSLAFGVGAANPAAEGYVGLTHFQLAEDKARYPGGLELINLAEPGATSSDLVEPDGQLERALNEIEERQNDEIPGNEVELISIDIGGNDLLQLAEPGTPCLIDTGSAACREALNDSLSDLQRNLARILSQLREAAPAAGIFAIDLYNPYSGTGDPREVLASVAVQQVNGVINATASEPALAVDLVSVFELFLGRGEQWVASDRIHPNDSGHLVISEALLAAIGDRPVAVPEDLASVPTGPSTGQQGPVSSDSSNQDDVSAILLLVAIGIAFAAGLIVSGTYFWARGRSN